ncbi:Hypothetical protein FKW44_007509 [Caligus rogercresseyi]|uniref:Uncharacterized protein n=1 Tax=Caligus rogercresseyi TaxID=217165 RepID=A0A7T8QTL5_CALRO|nr:Hypothetical protein FKW44_007509 [Caligus rogercresseyi]
MPERLPLLDVRIQETCRRRLHEWSLRSHPRPGGGRAMPERLPSTNLGRS